VQNITPDMVEGAYTYLKTTLPFRRWNLPHPDKIRFRVMVTRERYGHWNGTPEGDTVGELAVSIGLVDKTCLLTQTVGHEMVHIWQEEISPRSKPHGRVFNGLAALVCKRHGWDLATF
jgi:hypothetical protein